MSNVARKAMRIARGTALTIGVAVMLALVLGVATTALAGTGVGAPFDLGRSNAVNAVSRLVGNVAGSSLQIDNNSSGAAATALDLKVEAGRAPMKVNSSAKVADLNSDKLDGLDASAFVRSTYSVSESSDGGGFASSINAVSCDAGDFALSGGFGSVDAGTQILESHHTQVAGDNLDSWVVGWRNDATADSVSVHVLCADVGAPH